MDPTFPEFRFCEVKGCGRHGRLVMADGRIGMEVYSRKLARLVLWSAYEQGVIDQAWLRHLYQQVRASPLPESCDAAAQADPELCRRIHEWNGDLERGAALDPARFHEGTP